MNSYACCPKTTFRPLNTRTDVLLLQKQVGEAYAVQGAQTIAALDKHNTVSRMLDYTPLLHFFLLLSLLLHPLLLPLALPFPLLLLLPPLLLFPLLQPLCSCLSGSCSCSCLLLLNNTRVRLIARRGQNMVDVKQDLAELKAQSNRIEQILMIQEAEREGAQQAGQAARERLQGRQDSGSQQHLPELRRGYTGASRQQQQQQQQQPRQEQPLPPSSSSEPPQQQHQQPGFGAADDATAVARFLSRLGDSKKDVKTFWAAWNSGTVGSGAGAVSLPGGRSWSDMEAAFARRMSSTADDTYRVWRASRESTKSKRQGESGRQEPAMGQGKAFMFKIRSFIAELERAMAGDGEVEEELEALQLRVVSAGSINKYSQKIAAQEKLANRAAAEES